MKRLSRRMKWVVGAASALVLPAVTAFVLREHIAHHMMRSLYFRKTPEIQVRSLLPRFSEDRQLLAKYDVFRPSIGKKDARSHMAALYSSGKLDLPQPLTEALRGKIWREAKIDWKARSFDFAWMDELAAFDYWDPDPPISEGKKLVDMEIPEYGPFLNWAKLALLDGRTSGRETQAHERIQKLARLVWTNDNLVAAMSTIALLRIDGTIPEADLDRARRYFWAIGSGLDPRLSEQTWNRIAAPGPGQCLLTQGTTGTFILMRSLLGQEFSQEVPRLDRIFAMNEGKCRPNVLQSIWKKPDYPAWFKPDEDLFAMTTLGDAKVEKPAGSRTATLQELQKNPALAASVAYTLMSIAVPNPFSQYERENGEHIREVSGH